MARSGKRRVDFSSLSEEEQEEKAFAKVLRSVSVRETSTKKMQEKLRMAGFCDRVVSKCINKACDYGFIDDRRYSEMLIRSALASGKGLNRVEIEIKDLGIDPETLESYIEYLNEGEDAQLEAAISILNARPPKAKNKRDAAFRKLYSKGYSKEISSRAASQWLDMQKV